ncbi:MoaD/ThiS family protein [Saccharospirillum alexandrii]|uniref:MoaD/ThiS family protein n=1 Tax=Saccharospirillum alexandrii TaxID=2448477 RepID=UPI000FDC9EA2|nr:MoaD/ThiS family protein [Saccharospirillum alexandrii]
MSEPVQVKFFARLREELGVSSLNIPAEEVPDLDALLDWLVKAHPQWQPALQGKLMTAVNQNMTSSNATLLPGDEVALFPPVTGG